jgi:cobalt/nickel transport system permease protein
MGLTHAVIGVGEAAITVAVVSFVSQVRPDLLYRPEASANTAPSLPGKTLVGYGLLASLGVVLLLAPLASSLPDGLESVAEKLGFAGHLAAPTPAPLAGYEVAGVGGSVWSTILAGVAGTLLVFAVGWGVGRLVRLIRHGSRRPTDVSPQPDVS